MPDIFLSYSRDDQATARRFAEGFERAGWSVWWDQALHSGEDYDKVTEKALEEAKAVVVLWSRKSVDSRWVRAEATQADRNGTLVPAMIEDCKRPIMFELKQSADLSSWSGDPKDKTWQAYLASVRRLVEKGQQQQGGGIASLPTAVHPRRNIGLSIAIAAALLVTGAGLWALSRKGAEPVAPAVIATNTAVTLAVLPFANLSSDPEQEYFSDGLTEEILNQLAQIQALRVTGRTSSFLFKGKNEDMRVIGEKLGVANLLEGSVRKEGNQLRITAQLINSKDGAHLWSQTYARELKDVFAIQEEIAKDVARALSIKLEVGNMSRALGGTTNLEAYEKFLRARTLRNQLGTSLQEAVQLYREAIELDPTFWRAWFGMRGALIGIEVNIPERAEAAERELAEVDLHLMSAAPDLPAKHLMLAGHYFAQREWRESERALKAAFDGISASDVDGRLAIASMLLTAGRVSDALVHVERAAKAEPLSPLSSVYLQVALTQSGRLEEAQAEYERSRTLPGSHQGADSIALQRLFVATGADATAIRNHVRSNPASFAGSTPWRALIDNLESTPANGKTLIQGMLQDPDNQNLNSLGWIMEFAEFQRDRDAALVAAQRLLPLGGNSFIWMPLMSGMRADPRFKGILRNSGLVDYYRDTGNWGDFCKPVGAEDFECH